MTSCATLISIVQQYSVHYWIQTKVDSLGYALLVLQCTQSSSTGLVSQLFRSCLSWVADTNILITRFLAHEGVGQVADYLPVVCSDKRGTTLDLEADGYGWLV